jgi:Putative adhesin
MRSISARILILVIGLSLMLVAIGCHHRRSSNISAKPEDKIAPSDAGTGGDTAAGSIVDKGGDGVDLPEREEIRRSYQLAPGAKVRISNINGRVDVETADTAVAEVFIVRSAKKREELQFRQIRINHEPDLLQIHVVSDNRSFWSAFSSSTEARQRVMLKIPRKVDFEMHGLNGELSLGEIDGDLELSGVNGPVKVAQATGDINVRGVNGKIDLTMAKFTEEIDLHGINGNTDIHFIGDVNAEVDAHGMNGKVEADLPNVEVRGDRGYGRYSARIGSGGARIEIRGVNGNVHLSKAEKPGTTSAKAVGGATPQRSKESER